MNTRIQIIDETKPTYQEVEQALINVIKAGLYYRKPKDGKFMQNYKERIKKLCQAEDPEKYVLNIAMTILPNKDKYNKITNDYKEFYGWDPKILDSIIELYKLYYKLAKDYFIKEAQIDKEAEDFLNL
ncbi:15668_t:CDS:1 [Cetraspora pellucida]|uniref:15668_t:CDS:1 n=1 Tax=Cetraspora pellucida TaxID=1433469 RepID=A0A9N9PLP1_9GLOM|nr:15668_t:CDS:1 [Cetraspora pellucida]